MRHGPHFFLKSASYCSKLSPPLTEREPVFDCELLALDVAKIAEPGAQRLNQVGETGGREIAKTTTFAACCARATSGHAAAAPPRSAVKSRRLIGLPKAKDQGLSIADQAMHRSKSGPLMSALGQKRKT